MTDNERTELEAARAKCLNDILASDHPLKLVVAGPGTGKSYTFGKIIESTEGKVLVVSFLRSLVEDLAETFSAYGERVKVATFHGFAKSLLHSLQMPGLSNRVDYYPGFMTIVETDAKLMREDLKDGSIEKAYIYTDDSSGVASLGMQIGNYYDATGHTDAVYRVFNVLKADLSLIPEFERVLVDEYQDFNFLECELIKLITRGNDSVLVVGDDDQALYGFKDAKADYLRELYYRDDVKRFPLPYCTRCTSVIVEATHTVVGEAQRVELLTERLPREYVCFLPDKEAVSAQYPRIIHAQCSVERTGAEYMSRYISEQIANISEEDIAESVEAGNPTVLVISPSYIGNKIEAYLRETGVCNLITAQSSSVSIHMLDGYKRILKNSRSRLGWRIILGLVEPDGWEDWVKTALSSEEDLIDLIPDDFQSIHLRIVAILSSILRGEEIPESDILELTAALGISYEELRIILKIDPALEEESVNEHLPTVRITNMITSKGLQAEHVFVAGVSEKDFPKSNSSVKESEVCQLLVALTRARKSCTLVSCWNFAGQSRSQSLFIKWLNPHLEPRVVDKNYW